MKASFALPFEKNVVNSPARYGTVGYSEDSARILESYDIFISHYSLPISRLEENAGLRFYSLASEWKKEAGSYSLMVQKAMLLSYQKIIGMGATALPYIFRELQWSPDHWFWALQAITGSNPVKPENRGKVKEMAKDWLFWAKEKGYEW